MTKSRLGSLWLAFMATVFIHYPASAAFPTYVMELVGPAQMTQLQLDALGFPSHAPTPGMSFPGLPQGAIVEAILPGEIIAGTVPVDFQEEGSYRHAFLFKDGIFTTFNTTMHLDDQVADVNSSGILLGTSYGWSFLSFSVEVWSAGGSFVVWDRVTNQSIIDFSPSFDFRGITKPLGIDSTGRLLVEAGWISDIRFGPSKIDTYLLTPTSPVPEPATAVLVLAGLFFLVLRSRQNTTDGFRGSTRVPPSCWRWKSVV